MVEGGEPRAVTAVPSGVDAFAFSPDGKKLAYSTADQAVEKAGAARFEDAFEVGNNGMFDRSAPRPSHLWTVPVEGGEALRITKGDFSLTTSLSASPLSFSPDGRYVAVARTITPRSGDTDSARMHLIDTTSGLQRRITLRGGQESAPAFSPDGLQLLFLHPRDGDFPNVTEVFVAPAAGGDGRSVTRGLDRSITTAMFRPDGRSVLVGGNDGTRMSLWVQPLDGPARPLDLGPVVEYDGVAQAANGTLAFIGTERGRPAELYVLESNAPAPRRLTDFGAPLRALALGRTEGLEWPTSDGLLADGALTYPPDFTPSRAWPLVLLIHGGPTAASSEAFEPLAQLLAAKGYLVLQPNYRGSDNRGNAFERAITAGAGEGPGQDVMAGIEALEKRGFVDASRIAVSGWSYGGFMTGWLLVRYPDVWRAAVMGAAALDLFDMWSLSDLSAQRRHALVGSPFESEAHFREQSPLTHVAKVRTPTLILSNAADARVAVSQSYKFFRALRDKGVDTRFFVYPTGGHIPAGPVRQKDVWKRWMEWIERRFAA
jgi:dipeptidyl aminopeptidase/acylaminoacyl peptidase